jgi:hypothetical protein
MSIQKRGLNHAPMLCKYYHTTKLHVPILSSRKETEGHIGRRISRRRHVGISLSCKLCHHDKVHYFSRTDDQANFRLLLQMHYAARTWRLKWPYINTGRTENYQPLPSKNMRSLSMLRYH